MNHPALPGADGRRPFRRMELGEDLDERVELASKAVDLYWSRISRVRF